MERPEPLASDIARGYVNRFTLGSSAFSMVPVPGTSLALTAAEAAMIQGIAEIYGLKTSGPVWSIIFQTMVKMLGVSTFLKAGTELLNFVPILGWLTKPLVTASVVKSVGEAAILYFEAKLPGQSAYHKPTFNQMVTAFGESVVNGGLSEHQIGKYLGSYSMARQLATLLKPR